MRFFASLKKKKNKSVQKSAAALGGLGKSELDRFSFIIF